MSELNRMAPRQFSANGNFNGSAVGTVKPGTALALLAQGVSDGSLCANVDMGVLTTGLTMTPSWQVSHDGTNWIDLKVHNNASSVATAAGTGSLVTTKVALTCPSALPYPFVRCVVTSAGAVGAAADVYTVSYNWKKPTFG